MQGLGYTRYAAQGGDVGASVTDAMGRQAPAGLIGIHTNLLVTVLSGATFPEDTEDERARTAGDRHLPEGRLRLLPRDGNAAADDRLLAAGLADLAGRLDARPRYGRLLQGARAFVDGKPSGNLTRDHILDNITLYWLTGTGTSAARSYWENGRAADAAAGQAPPPVSLPVGFTTFPGEIWRTPAQLGGGVVPERRLLQRGRQGRALRRLGRAAALLGRDPGRVQDDAVAMIVD